MFENPENKFEESVDDVIEAHIDWGDGDSYVQVAQAIISIFDHIDPVIVTIRRDLEDKILEIHGHEFMNDLTNYLEDHDIEVQII